MSVLALCRHTCRQPWEPVRKRSVKQTALWPPRGQAEVMRAELAQSWRDSDVELGLKARRSPVSAAAAKALEATFSISEAASECRELGPWAPNSLPNSSVVAV